MEHNGDDLDSVVRRAVAAFAHQVGESSDQLSAAAERFASEAARAIGSATARAEEASRQGQAASAAAAASATEAREAADSVRASLSEATSQVKQEAREYFGEASKRVEESVTRASEKADEWRQASEAALETIGQAASQTRSYAVEAAVAAKDAQLAAADAASGRQFAGDEDQAIEAARSARVEIETLRAAVNAAESAAAEARQLAEQANTLAQQAPQTPETDPAVSAGAREVLDRLEADYMILTHLVQELHLQVSAVPAQAPESSATEGKGNMTGGFESLFGAVDSSPEASPAPEPTVPVQEAAAPEPAMETASKHTAEIAGRVLVSISPVPDFDRLLSLDGALGRMGGVGNVTLADYAEEEVTFRLEVEKPISVEDFRDRLSESAGSALEVVSIKDHALSLRLAS